MVTVKVSHQSALHIPTTLSTKLALVDGDQVKLARWGSLIVLQKLRKASHPRLLRDLAGLVKSSQPRASVDVARYMTRRGYEYLYEDEDQDS